MYSEKVCGRIIYSIGILFVLCGLLIVFTWPWIFDVIWQGNLQLRSSSESYELWKKTPMPLFMELYLFNWTNSDEFLHDETVKPAFTQVGPFVFKEVHQRVDVSWNNDKTVTYNQSRSWHFIPDKSVDLSTPVTNINVVLTAVTKAASNRGIFVKELLALLTGIYKEKLIITRPASQWLFDGISDKLLNFLKKIDPASVPFDKFGWFYGRNLSSAYDGRFNIRTGTDNIYNLGLLNEWNSHHRTEYYNGECSIVRGTTSEIFAPLKSHQENLTIFLSDFCGTITLNKSGSVWVNGLEGYRYFGSEHVFDNGTKYPGAQCFCTGTCSPSGVRNVTLCRGAPIFISFPHFYLGDPVYVKSVAGLEPKKSEHEFYITIDPLSGLPLEVRAQLQVNILLEPISLFPMFSKVPKIYLPVMWFRQRVKLTDELVDLASKLQLLHHSGYSFGCGLTLVGLVIITIWIVRLRYLQRSAHSEPHKSDKFLKSEDHSDSGDEA